MAPEPPLDPELPLNSPFYNTLFNKLSCLHRLLWHLFFTMRHHDRKYNIFSSTCHHCHYHHQQPHHPPQGIALKQGSGCKGPVSPFPVVVSHRVRLLYPFLRRKYVGTKNSLTPTYFQELKVSIFHIDCFDAVKCKLQFP